MDTKLLDGKTVAITGCTGGLGRAVCFKLASLGADLVMLNRNPQKSKKLADELTERFEGIKITHITTELEDVDSVKSATEQLIALKPDIFIANAGAYSIPRHTCASGYDNVFQINFVSPYFIARRLTDALPSVKVVIVGSLAHSFCKIDSNDVDFRTRKSAMKVYGNSKRFLMLALSELYENSAEQLAIVHPGITYTNITSHYPKLLSAIIKYPMKLIFMKPEKAANCVLYGVLNTVPSAHWIGPRVFGIWGKPKVQKLKAALTDESKKALDIAENIIR